MLQFYLNLYVSTNYMVGPTDHVLGHKKYGPSLTVHVRFMYWVLGEQVLNVIELACDFAGVLVLMCWWLLVLLVSLQVVCCKSNIYTDNNYLALNAVNAANLLNLCVETK